MPNGDEHYKLGELEGRLAAVEERVLNLNVSINTCLQTINEWKGGLAVLKLMVFAGGLTSIINIAMIIINIVH